MKIKLNRYSFEQFMIVLLGLLLPLINLRISIGNFEVTLFLIALGAYFVYMTLRRKVYLKHVYILPLLVFTIYLFSIIYSSNTDSALRYILKIVLCLLVLSFTRRIEWNGISLELFRKAVLFSGNLYTLMLIYKYVYVFKKPYIGIVLDYPTEMGKNSLAFVLIILTTFALADLVIKKDLKNRLVSTTMNLPIYFAIILVDSRGALLSLMLAISTAFIVNLRRRTMPKLILILLLSFVLVYFVTSYNLSDGFSELISSSSNGSIAIRTNLIDIGINEFLKSPIFGSGLNTFQIYSFNQLGFSYLTHNDYLKILVEQGLVGFLVFMTFIIVTLRTSLANYSRNNYKIDFTIFIITLGLTSYLFFINSIDNILIWFFFGLVFSRNGGIKYEKRLP